MVLRRDDAIIQSDGEGFSAARGDRRPIASIRPARSITPTGSIPAMKLIRYFAAAALATLAIAPRTQAQGTMLRFESNIPAADATSKAMEIFKAELAR